VKATEDQVNELVLRVKTGLAEEKGLVDDQEFRKMVKAVSKEVASWHQPDRWSVILPADPTVGSGTSSDFADVEMGEDSSRIMARADLLERVRRAMGSST